MLREIKIYPDPILSVPAKPVDTVDEGIRSLLADMAETMAAENGVGLAAPQVGVSLRVAVADITGCTDDTGLGLIKFVNPEITARGEEIEWEEGCLSVPGFLQKMKRRSPITMSFLDEEGVRKEIRAEGLLAVVFQHEIDHLDGKLIIDSASQIKRELYLKKRAKEMNE